MTPCQALMNLQGEERGDKEMGQLQGQVKLGAERQEKMDRKAKIS